MAKVGIRDLRGTEHQLFCFGRPAAVVQSHLARSRVHEQPFQSTKGLIISIKDLHK
jgi:hypothetical protein